MKEKTCCFTGHRKVLSKDYPSVFSQTEKAVDEAIQRGYVYFGAGGALGFDTIAALVVLKLKQKHPQIRLILVLPCVNQTKGWKQEDIDTYRYIRERADKVVYVSREYQKGCMHKRNRHLVDNSSLCICYLTGEKGGTFYTVSYSLKNGVRVVNVAK